MNSNKKIVALMLLLGVLIPSFALAVGPPSTIIPCGLYDANNDKVVDDPCTFEMLVQLAKNVIDFLIFKIAAPLAAIMFAYAGFLYITNGGNEGKVKQAHEVFLYVFWGFVVCLGAWLTVNMILSVFLVDKFNFLK